MSALGAGGAPGAALPRLSVVVPVYDAAALLPTTLPAMRAQDLAAEWIFVDDGSTDGSAELLERLLTAYPPAAPGTTARVLRHEANRGRAAARQTGLDALAGDVAVFLDVDMEPAPGFLSAHARMHTRPEVVGAVSPERWADVDATEPYGRYLTRHPRGAAAVGPDRPLPFRTFIIGYTSVRASALHEVGGFDAAMPYGEDLDLAVRLDARYPRGLWLAADAVVLQHGAPRLDAALAGWRRFGRASVPVLLEKHPALASTIGADLVEGRGARRWAGEALRPAAPVLRVLVPHLPAVVQPAVVRVLVGTAIAAGLREARREARASVSSRHPHRPPR